jgi:hypothetical protein
MTIEVISSSNRGLNQFDNYEDNLNHWITLCSDRILFEYFLKREGGYFLDMGSPLRDISKSRRDEIKSLFPHPRNMEDSKFLYSTLENLAINEHKFDEINSLDQIKDKDWYRKYVLINLSLNHNYHDSRKLQNALELEIFIIKELTNPSPFSDKSIFKNVHHDYYINEDLNSIINKYNISENFIEILNAIELAKYRKWIDHEVDSVRKYKKKGVSTFRSKLTNIQIAMLYDVLCTEEVFITNTPSVVANALYDLTAHSAGEMKQHIFNVNKDKTLKKGHFNKKIVNQDRYKSPKKGEYLGNLNALKEAFVNAAQNLDNEIEAAESTLSDMQFKFKKLD